MRRAGGNDGTAGGKSEDRRRIAINDPTAIGADLAAKQAQRTSSLLSVWTEARTPKRRSSVELVVCRYSGARSPGDGSESGEIGYDILQGKPAPKEPVLIR